MTTVSRLVLAGALTSIGAAASAQTALDATFSLGYSNSSSDIADYSTTSLGIATDIALTDAFSIEADLDFARLDLDDVAGTDVDESLDLQRFALAPRYRLENGLVLGAYVQRASLDIDELVGGTDDLEADSYGLTLGYEAGGLDVEGYIGQTDTDPELPDVDINDLGFRADYEISDALSVGGLFARTTLDQEGGPIEVDLDTLGVAGAYDITPAFSVFGGLGSFDASGTPLAGSSMALGVGYDLNNVGQLPPVTVSLELARTTVEIGPSSDAEDEIDTIRLGLSIPLGEGASDVPLNSATSSFGGADRTALPSAIFGGL